jgi:hypothetical protein
MYCVGAYQISLVPRIVSFDPKLRTFGNRLVSANFVRAPLLVFRFTLQGFNISIVGLSSLSETA